MKIGVYTACLPDMTLVECLDTIGELGLDSIEVHAGGFLNAPHLPVDGLLASPRARREYLAQISDRDIALTALNVNCNPLHPDPEVRGTYVRDLWRAIDLAGLLGVRNVVTMSGLPGAHPGCLAPTWMPQPWHSAATDVLRYQWDDVAVPFWRDIERRARAADVRVCIEMHPHNLVYNPATLMRLIERTDSEHIGAEMDPSHLFWQGIEPIEAINYLGDRVFNAAAKDTRVNEANCRLNGILDDRYVTPDADDPSAITLGGRYLLNRSPANPSWQFVAVGRGHDVEYWTSFVGALRKVNPSIAINIEHEDDELDVLDGLRFAADTLTKASGGVRP
ncbi:sugar phosphate isomerase/epimerase family protein [Mycobacterium lacus]|uniref:Sugar phosphate isomerase n=1 Tax=Mycobacterium lacus TaxID=169765 RepID=A0A1X1YCA7_9MYCO|nr:sugar phosphate isomerase/epimerase [Mycobacterium lacus]MCV7124812.1 sugar phosphate isomerase/epimerase [Mycobacterium lacus]ORW08709.1 sugar phosphate isomerase [Mycobacterium lacus]BBX94918.1 sugar phosphate isomerase [Mycobacterium lacus]